MTAGLECNHQVFWETPSPRSSESPEDDEEWTHTDRNVAYTLIGDVLRNPDGSGSYSLTLHYRDGTCEVHTVVVAADGSAKVYNQGGFVVGSYPKGATVVPPQDFANRLGYSGDHGCMGGSDTAEAWPY